ncbi:putative protein isoform X2 [Capsicum annuum]|uniref:uncharacterized protein LOC107863589 isoform X2 n=1 Tax=Capsicum annuum TaxID=4072 RepID=UPI001FB13F7B|nr:uncharacterized protein LOC107863589 isoform X2 [Capsicum annuum]
MAEKKRALLVSKREKRESRVNYQTYVKQMYETSLPLRLLHLLFPFDCCYLLLDCCSSSRSLRVLVKLLPIRRSRIQVLEATSGRNTRWRSCAEGQQSSESPGTIGRSKGAAMASSHQQISVTIATEFVRWNEEAVSRCTLFSSQTYRIVPNACLICLYRLLQLLLT